MDNKVSVNKLDYEIFQYSGGYYGICKIGTNGGECVFAGDSAWEESYDLDLIKDVHKAWNSELIYTGDKYGYKIEL